MAGDLENRSGARHARHSQAQSQKAQAPITHDINSSATRRAHKAQQSRQPRGRNIKKEKHEHSKKQTLIIVLISLIVLALVSFGVWTIASKFFGSEKATTEVEVGKTVTITIPDGSSGSDIAKLLVDNAVISDSSEFLQEVHNQNADQKMKSGTYDFVTGTDMSEIVKLLVAGPNSNSSRLTVPEGYTVAKIANLVQDQFGISADDFKNQAKASNYVADYDFLKAARNDSLEGFLFASTYDFGSGEVSADSIIRAMLDQYKAQVAGLDFATAASNINQKYGIDFSQYDFLTLASIIEREAANDDDRYKVASVFYNRLHANMALESDATMSYVTGGEVTADDLKQESPYNSYLNKGLTPTPICSPSMASIQAALNPADTDYMYFLIIENGNYSNHSFSITYEEHNQAIAKAKSEMAGQ